MNPYAIVVLVAGVFLFGIGLGMWAAALYSERERNHILVAVLQGQRAGPPKPAKVYEPADAETQAYRHISETAIERLTEHLVSVEGVDPIRAREHAADLVAQGEHYGAEVSP